MSENSVSSTLFALLSYVRKYILCDFFLYFLKYIFHFMMRHIDSFYFRMSESTLCVLYLFVCKYIFHVIMRQIDVRYFRMSESTLYVLYLFV